MNTSYKSLEIAPGIERGGNLNQIATPRGWRAALVRFFQFKTSIARLASR